MPHPLALQTGTDSHLRHQVGGELFQDSGPHPANHVITIADFKNDGVGPLEMQ